MSDGLRARWARRCAELLLALAFFGAVSWFQVRDLLAVGTVAPIQELSTLDGKVSSQQLRGKRVWLHFWATWCEVCRLEHDMVRSLYAGLEQDEVLVSIVASAESAQAVREYAARHGLTYPIALATPELLRRFRVSVFPTNYFLDDQGRVSSQGVGMSNRWAIRSHLWWAR